MPLFGRRANVTCANWIRQIINQASGAACWKLPTRPEGSQFLVRIAKRSSSSSSVLGGAAAVSLLEWWELLARERGRRRRKKEVLLGAACRPLWQARPVHFIATSIKFESSFPSRFASLRNPSCKQRCLFEGKQKTSCHRSALFQRGSAGAAFVQLRLRSSQKGSLLGYKGVGQVHKGLTIEPNGLVARGQRVNGKGGCQEERCALLWWRKQFLLGNEEEAAASIQAGSSFSSVQQAARRCKGWQAAWKQVIS